MMLKRENKQRNKCAVTSLKCIIIFYAETPLEFVYNTRSTPWPCTRASEQLSNERENAREEKKKISYCPRKTCVVCPLLEQPRQWQWQLWFRGKPEIIFICSANVRDAHEDGYRPRGEMSNAVDNVLFTTRPR